MNVNTTEDCVAQHVLFSLTTKSGIIIVGLAAGIRTGLVLGTMLCLGLLLLYNYMLFVQIIHTEMRSVTLYIIETGSKYDS